MKCDRKKYKLIYVESSCLSYTLQKKKDNEIKLWHEINDRIYWIHKSSGSDKGKFEIIRMQIVRQIMYLNVLIREVKNVHRYYHFYKAEILMQ